MGRVTRQGSNPAFAGSFSRASRSDDNPLGSKVCVLHLLAFDSLVPSDCGLMTTAGGIGHTLPYLIANFRTATAVAVLVVAIELLLISWIRNRHMDTPFLRAAFQVVVEGVLVFLVGTWIGSS